MKTILVIVEENVRGRIRVVGSFPEDKWIREIEFTWIRSYGLKANSNLDCCCSEISPFTMKAQMTLFLRPLSYAIGIPFCILAISMRINLFMVTKEISGLISM